MAINLNSMHNPGFVKQERLELPNICESSHEALDDIFSDMNPLFDVDFFLEDDSLKLVDDTPASDVILSDRMMTEAAITLPKAEPLTPEVDRQCSNSSVGSAHSGDVSASDDSGGEELPSSKPSSTQHSGYSNSHHTYVSTRPSGYQLPPPPQPPRHAQKRHREDSTDALDHTPYRDEPAPARRGLDAGAYGRSMAGGCPLSSSGRSVRSLIRPDALPESQGSVGRRPVQYVVRQGGSGSGSVYIPGQGMQSVSNNGRQILPRNRSGANADDHHHRQKHYGHSESHSSNSAAGTTSPGSGGNSGNSSSNNGYVLYPPTPPSSAHCSSDSDDGSYNGGYSYHHHGHHRSHHHGQPMFQSPIPQSGELHLTEEERRTFIAEGFPIPCKLPLTKQEERALKKVRRKIKNKISAQESRRKKKEYLESLEKKIEQYSREYSEVKRRCESLEATNKSLLGQLRNLQGMLGKASSSTGTCLMVLVMCFAMLIGGGGSGDNPGKSASVVIRSSAGGSGSTLPTLWAPQWAPNVMRSLGYHGPPRESEAKCKARGPPLGPAEPQSRVLLGADDESESYSPYGPHLLGTNSCSSEQTQEEEEVWVAEVAPQTPELMMTRSDANFTLRVSTLVAAQPTLPLNTTY